MKKFPIPKTKTAFLMRPQPQGGGAKKHFRYQKSFIFDAKNSIFDASTATGGGGALVSGVLVPMDASKMLFLAKIGNYFTFEVRSETFSLLEMNDFQNTKIQKYEKR